MILASKDSWKGIPENLRKTLIEQLKEAVAYGNNLAAQQSLYEKQLILDSGQTVAVQMTVEQRELWVEAMQGVWQQFENEIGSSLIDAAASAR
jgi:C4-dicarboxylate-binding protein DctP